MKALLVSEAHGAPALPCWWVEAAVVVVVGPHCLTAHSHWSSMQCAPGPHHTAEHWLGLDKHTRVDKSPIQSHEIQSSGGTELEFCSNKGFIGAVFILGKVVGDVLVTPTGTQMAYNQNITWKPFIHSFIH